MATRPLDILFLALAVAGLAGPHPAWAHAQLVRFDPADHARLEAAPARVHLWFDERLEEGSNSVRVITIDDPARQASFTTGRPRVDPADPSHLMIELAPLPPGHYAVEWRVLSRDGHTAVGRISFEVRAAP